jgi:hypothetical protein
MMGFGMRFAAPQWASLASYISFGLSQLWVSHFRRAEEATNETLAKLGTTYLDLVSHNNP